MIENYNWVKKHLTHYRKNGFENSYFNPNVIEVMKNTIDSFFLSGMKIVNINENEKNLFLTTKNQIFPRKPPFINCFLDTSIKFSNIEIKGIFFCPVVRDDNMLKEYIEQDTVILSDEDIWTYINMKKYGIAINLFGLDKSDNTLVFIYDTIIFPDEIYEFGDRINNMFEMLKKQFNESGKYMYPSEDESDEIKKTIKLFVCNFLDFLNHPEIELTHHNMDKINKRRQKHNKKLIPSYYNVKMSHTLRRFVNEYGQSSRKAKYSHKFWVRGHFMRFWDRQKYHVLYEKLADEILDPWYMYDEEYDVIMRWKKPYVKGEGILPNQVYELEE